MTPMTVSEPEAVWPLRAILGEGPVWAQGEEALYFVDIKGQRLHRYAPRTGDRTSWVADEPIGCVAPPDASGMLLAATRSGFAWLQPAADGTLARKPAASPEAATLPGNRFNDGKLAPDGSFWAGTLDESEQVACGAWWRFDPATLATVQLDTGYMVTNGPAFDFERSRVYLTDSARQCVFVADWIAGAGFKNKRIFAQFGQGDGYPDGMQVHADGSLWIAFWDGACLRRLAPDGTLVQTITLPVTRPTSLAFTSDFARAFVTSASIDLEGPREGALLSFQIEC